VKARIDTENTSENSKGLGNGVSKSLKSPKDAARKGLKEGIVRNWRKVSPLLYGSRIENTIKE
jgi:hypothetical protein